MYTPAANAGRIKLKIPYGMKAEREVFKKLDGTFYHYDQKLWSIVNTSGNIKHLKRIFGKKLKMRNTQAPSALPSFDPSKKIQIELDRNQQKMVLKGFSPATIRNYQHNLLHFFKYFETAELRTISKEQIEGYVFYRQTSH